MFKSSISELISSNKSLFEDVNDSFQTYRDDAEYTILNYEKILSDMCDYLQGYYKYKESGEDKYADKLLSSTRRFYDDMFTNVEYRIPFTLTDMKDINEKFLINTKKLQSLLESDSDELEETSMLKMSDNQYRKIMKVYKDDVKIYLYLISRNSHYGKTISPDLYSAFMDENTPVIHKLKKKR